MNKYLLLFLSFKTAVKLILILTISSSLYSQEKSNNLNFMFTNNGYGFGYEFEKFSRENLSIGADLRFYDILKNELKSIILSPSNESEI